MPRSNSKSKSSKSRPTSSSGRLRELLGEGYAGPITKAMRRTIDEELIPLRQQVAEIELLLARARRKIDPSLQWMPRPPMPAPPRPPTLHAAIAHILAERRNEPIDVGTLTRDIVHLGLYSRRDGRPPTVNDVSARISAYPGLFRREGYRVRLRLMPSRDEP